MGLPNSPSPKKDGCLQYCMDYQSLNVVTKLDHFHLLRIDDTLDQLEHEVFLNIGPGFWVLAGQDEWYVKGKDRIYYPAWFIIVMPFGLTNALLYSSGWYMKLLVSWIQ